MSTGDRTAAPPGGVHEDRRVPRAWYAAVLVMGAGAGVDPASLGLDGRAGAGLRADGVDLGVGPGVGRVVDLIRALHIRRQLLHRRAGTGLLTDRIDLGVGPRIGRVVDLIRALHIRRQLLH